MHEYRGKTDEDSGISEHFGCPTGVGVIFSDEAQAFANDVSRRTSGHFARQGGSGIKVEIIGILYNVHGHA